MPIELHGPLSRLPWRQTARLFVLQIQMRWLDRQLASARQEIVQHGLHAASDRFPRVARRWLVTHEAISALLRSPEPPHVTQLRAALKASILSDDGTGGGGSIH